MKPRINLSKVRIRNRNVFLILFICLALTGLAWAGAYSEAVLADSPLSYFQFEDAASADGNSCADTMGLTTAVYRNRGAEKADISLVASRPGLGQAAEFHGTADSNGNFVEIQDNIYSGDKLTNSNMTVEFWVSTIYPSTGYATWVNYHGESDFGPIIGNTGDEYQPSNALNGQAWYGWPPMDLNDGEWHHYVQTFVYDGDANTTATIYLDGDVWTSHVYTGEISPNTNNDWKPILLAAGGDPYYVSNGYVGLMDEVAIYDYALSEVQIETHYNAEANEVDTEILSYATEVDADNPVVWIRFDSEDDVLDETGNNWVTYGSLGQVVSGAGYAGNSFFFDVNESSSGAFAAAVCKNTGGPSSVYGDEWAFAPNDITIEFWYKTLPDGQAQPNTYGLLFQQIGPYTNEPCAPAVGNSDGTIRIFGGSGVEYTVSGDFDGEWHHYVVTYDENYNDVPNNLKASLYIDGQWKAEALFTDAGSFLGPELDHMVFGAENDYGYSYNIMPGYWDEIAIYDGILSADRIAIHHTTWRPAPAAPNGLEATGDNGFVLLDWDDNNEPDVNGYNVYRSTTSGSGYARLNDTLSTDSNYLDNDANLVLGTTYYYVVTAVDTNGHASDYSDEVSAIPTDYATRTFVYKYKSTKLCYDYDSSDSNWVDSKGREQGYFIIDVNYGLACQIDWDSGGLTYQRVYDSNFSTTMEPMNGRTTWLFSQFGNDYNDFSLMVQGNARSSTIAGTAIEVASSLKGISINNFGSDPRYIEMGKANLKLDKAWTTLSIGNHWSCSQTEAAIVADLNDAGYTELTDLTELASDSNYYDLVTPDVNVLVYNCSEKGMQYSDSGGPWLSEKGKDKFFLVIDVNSGEYTRIDYDKKAGTYEETTSGTYDVLGIQGVKSTWWVVLDLDSDSALVLSGKTKTKKLGTQAVSVASKLKGYLTYNQGTSPQYIGDKTVNCTLYKTLSIEAVEGSYTLSQAVDAVKTFLDSKGYTEL